VRCVCCCRLIIVSVGVNGDLVGWRYDNMNDTETLLFPASTALGASNLSIWSDNSSTAGGAQPMGRMAKGIVTLLYTTVIVVAVGGNVVVCFTVATQRRMHTVTNLFIASLAASDVMMASFCIPLTFISDVIVQHWPFPSIVCPIALYAQVIYTSMSCSTFSWTSA